MTKPTLPPCRASYNNGRFYDEEQMLDIYAQGRADLLAELVPVALMTEYQVPPAITVRGLAEMTEKQIDYVNRYAISVQELAIIPKA